MAGFVESVLGLVLGMVPCCALLAIPSFFVGVAVLLIYVASKRRRGYESVLKELALETGGEFMKGDVSSTPTLGGEYKGRRFLIDTAVRAHEDADGRTVTTYYMRFQLWHKGRLAGDIAVSREGLFSGLGKALGRQDIQIGNEDFDRAFMVSGKDEAEVRRLLDAEVQGKFLESRLPMTVTADRVCFERAGVIESKQEILRVLDFMGYLAGRAEAL